MQTRIGATESCTFWVWRFQSQKQLQSVCKVPCSTCKHNERPPFLNCKVLWQLHNVVAMEHWLILIHRCLSIQSMSTYPCCCGQVARALTGHNQWLQVPGPKPKPSVKKDSLSKVSSRFGRLMEILCYKSMPMSLRRIFSPSPHQNKCSFPMPPMLAHPGLFFCRGLGAYAGGWGRGLTDWNGHKIGWFYKISPWTCYWE